MDFMFFVILITALSLIYYGYIHKIENDVKKKELELEERKIELEIMQLEIQKERKKIE
ncbi:hypothetical protein ACQUWN_11140 [Rossellomorea aquimaris]|uniref:hypothetical protein n=1 Tax=Bacillaceae TaxID=186817 RepID=UPI0013B06014|nr:MULTISPECIES: hypothetical protein [Bacillaceae]